MQALYQALDRRRALLARLHAEGTDCYRLFHGAVEGVSGLTIDRYGPIVLVQTFRAPLDEAGRLDIAEVLAPIGRVVFQHRGEGGPVLLPPDVPRVAAHEQGVSFEISVRERGDAGLFLDFRAARRWLAASSSGAEVLNLFAYTCGAGVAAARGGACAVLNVDFSPGALAVGERNAEENGISQDVFSTVRADVLPTLRQLAGLPVKGRGRRHRGFRRFAPRHFDIVVLDPPTWSTSPFGAVDPVRDYPSLFKPALLCLREGGCVLATNHVSTVDRDDWHDILVRAAAKAGRPLRSLEVLEPDDDFPSPDGQPPLKMVIARA